MAVVGGAVEIFRGGGPRPTMASAAAITAGRLVEMTANRTVQMAGATSSKVVGIAMQGCDAVGDKIAVDPTGTWYCIASGAIAAGDQLVTDTSGRVKTLAAAAGATAADINNARAVIGEALASAIDAASVPVLLRIAS